MATLEVVLRKVLVKVSLNLLGHLVPFLEAHNRRTYMFLKYGRMGFGSPFRLRHAPILAKYIMAPLNRPAGYESKGLDMWGAQGEVLLNLTRRTDSRWSGLPPCYEALLPKNMNLHFRFVQGVCIFRHGFVRTL